MVSKSLHPCMPHIPLCCPVRKLPSRKCLSLPFHFPPCNGMHLTIPPSSIPPNWARIHHIAHPVTVEQPTECRQPQRGYEKPPNKTPIQWQISTQTVPSLCWPMPVSIINSLLLPHSGEHHPPASIQTCNTMFYITPLNHAVYKHS